MSKEAEAYSAVQDDLSDAEEESAESSSTARATKALRDRMVEDISEAVNDSMDGYGMPMDTEKLRSLILAVINKRDEGLAKRLGKIEKSIVYAREHGARLPWTLGEIIEELQPKVESE